MSDLLPSMVTTFCSAVIEISSGAEARYRQRNLVAVLSQPFDVVGRVVVLAGPLGHFREVEKAIEANGRTPQGRKVVIAHSQILQRASWLRAAPDTTGARLLPGPIRRPDATVQVATKKLAKSVLVSRGAKKIMRLGRARHPPPMPDERRALANQGPPKGYIRPSRFPSRETVCEVETRVKTQLLHQAEAGSGLRAAASEPPENEGPAARQSYSGKSSPGDETH